MEVSTVNFFKKLKKETEYERIQREKEEKIEREKQVKTNIILFTCLLLLVIIGFVVLSISDKKMKTTEQGKSVDVTSTTQSSYSETSAESSSKHVIKETYATSSSKHVIKDSIEDSNINPNNNLEFKHIITDSNDVDAYKAFVEKFRGKTIEFDANIAHMVLSGNYKTRYNILIYSGDYSEISSPGVGFHIQNKNIVNDLKLIGDNIPDTIGAGQNIHIIAEVLDYADNDLIIIDPIETRIR